MEGQQLTGADIITKLTSLPAVVHTPKQFNFQHAPTPNCFHVLVMGQVTVCLSHSAVLHICLSLGCSGWNSLYFCRLFPFRSRWCDLLHCKSDIPIRSPVIVFQHCVPTLSLRLHDPSFSFVQIPQIRSHNIFIHVFSQVKCLNQEISSAVGYNRMVHYNRGWQNVR
jgi:hypothetical protein